jgi:hypothetical protein
MLCTHQCLDNSKQGKWRLGPRIGSGSFGTVHKGMNEETGQVRCTYLLTQCIDFARLSMLFVVKPSSVVAVAAAFAVPLLS